MPPEPQKRRGPPRRAAGTGQNRNITDRQTTHTARNRQALRHLQPRRVDLGSVRAAVHALRLHTPIALSTPDFCAVFGAKEPEAFWELVDHLAFAVLVEAFRFGKHETIREKEQRLAELMIEWLAAEGIE